MTKKDIYALYHDTELSSSMEDYIEAILMLTEKNKVVRVRDIAAILKIKMPSVTAALDKLKGMGLIEYEKYGYVELTSEGRLNAELVYHRHTCLTDFFERVLRLPHSIAEEDACKVEHALSDETCVRIHLFLKFFLSEEKASRDWVKRYKKMFPGQ